MTTKLENAGLAAALAAFQAELPKLPKSKTAKTGTFDYDYADLAEASLIILPLLAKQGLSFSSKPTVLDGRPVLVSTLRHVSGESDEAIWELPPKGSPQQIGSAITYGRRYTLCAMTGVAAGDEDDDGRKAEENEHRPGGPTLAQEQLFDEFIGEIATAPDRPALVEIGGRIKSAHGGGRLTKWQLDRLHRLSSERLVAIEPPPAAKPAEVTT